MIRLGMFFFKNCSLILCVSVVYCAIAADEPVAFSDCDACPMMVLIPQGSFELRVPPWGPGRPNDEGYFYPVTFAKGYAIGKYEITVLDWRLCVADSACPPLEMGGSDRDQIPVFNVTWSEANRFAKWLSKKTGFIYRLPSNAEWEYAARAGLGMNRHFDIPAKALCNFSNTYDQTAHQEYQSGSEFVPCSDGYHEFAPVGQFAPNAFGLHDVIGNMSEWTEDCVSPDWRGAPLDGTAWLKGDCSLRGFRGGSWLNNEPYYLVESSRFRYSGSRADDLGFRLVRDIE